MAYGQSANAQTNQNVEQMLQWLMEKNLMRGRQSGQMDYLNKSSQANMDLEATRTGNDFALQSDKYFKELSMLPEVQRIDAEIFTRQRDNQDVTDLLLKKKQIAEDRTRAYISSLTGKIPENNPQFERAVAAMGEDFAQFNQEAGRNIRSVADAATSKEDQRIREKAIAVDQQQANTAAGNLAAKNKPGPGSDYYKPINDKISSAKSFLVKILTGEQSMKGEGEIPTPAQITNLITRLNKLDTKAMTGQLTPQEMAEVDNAYNIYGMKATGAKDEFGYSVGETKDAPNGFTYEYVGQNTWRKLTP